MPRVREESRAGGEGVPSQGHFYPLFCNRPLEGSGPCQLGPATPARGAGAGGSPQALTKVTWGLRGRPLTWAGDGEPEHQF